MQWGAYTTRWLYWSRMRRQIVLIFDVNLFFKTKRDNFHRGPVETPSRRGLPIGSNHFLLTVGFEQRWSSLAVWRSGPIASQNPIFQSCSGNPGGRAASEWAQASADSGTTDERTSRGPGPGRATSNPDLLWPYSPYSTIKAWLLCHVTRLLSPLQDSF